VWAVTPLDLPLAGSDLATTAASESVRLFVERALARSPGFGATLDNVAVIGEICRRLDGLPLALELAAARARVLALDEILHRIDGRFTLLTTTRPGVPTRHQSLRAAVEWSYDLLPEDERRLFRRLSVCIGGFDLGTAEALDSPATATLDRLSRLIDKSLISPSEHGQLGMRYRLLETLRAYGHERLIEAKEDSDARDRHLDHFLGVAAERDLWGGGPDQWRVLAALEADHDNIRAVLGWALRRRSADALRLAAQLTPFWRWRGHRSEGRRYLAAALDAAPRDTDARGRALVGAASLAYDQGDGEAALALAFEAAELCRQSGDAVGLGMALHRLAVVPEGDDERREARLLEALALFEAAHYAFGIGSALSTLGHLAAERGDFARAEMLCAHSLRAHQLDGDERASAAVLSILGAIVDAQGDTVRARELYEASLATARRFGLRAASAHFVFALVRLADLASSEGRTEEAQSMLRDGVAELRGFGYVPLADAVHWSGVVAARHGDIERGVSLIAAAAGHWGSFDALGGITGFRPVRDRRAASLVEVRAGLPPDQFARAWADGERMGLEQAAELIVASGSRPADN
jgi:tetratricopeptide (TPR) repeat protein